MSMWQDVLDVVTNVQSESPNAAYDAAMKGFSTDLPRCHPFYVNEIVDREEFPAWVKGHPPVLDGSTNSLPPLPFPKTAFLYRMTALEGTCHVCEGNRECRAPASASICVVAWFEYGMFTAMICPEKSGLKCVPFFLNNGVWSAQLETESVPPEFEDGRVSYWQLAAFVDHLLQLHAGGKEFVQVEEVNGLRKKGHQAAPEIKINTIRLRPTARGYRSWLAGVPKGLWHMPLHDVRSHLRHMRSGKVVRVAAHRRGNEQYGVRLHEYEVTIGSGELGGAGAL